MLTNVPGPRTQLYFCGQPMRRIMFWVPQTGRIGLGMSIISYCGEVSIGVMVDDGLVDDPDAILAAFTDELNVLRDVGPALRAAPAQASSAVDAVLNPESGATPMPSGAAAAS